MPFYGCIVVIKSTGADGSTYPLMNKTCLLGRDEGCDIKIQLPIVSKEHARISVTVEDGKAFLTALSKTNPTKLNGHSVDKGVRNPLLHKDQFTIGERHFRWMFPEGSLHCETQSNIEAPIVNHNVSLNESSTAIDMQGSTSPLGQEQVPVTKCYNVSTPDQTLSGEMERWECSQLVGELQRMDKKLTAGDLGPLVDMQVDGYAVMRSSLSDLVNIVGMQYSPATRVVAIVNKGKKLAKA